MHHQRARAPGDRRGDGRVLELHLRVLQRRLVGIHGGVERGDRRLRGIDLLAGRDASLRQLLEPLGLLRGVGGLREIAIEVGLRLLQRRFERTPIEREQDLPGGDVVAFGEVDARQLAGRLGANRHARERLGRADDADLDRHRLPNDRSDRDGHRRAPPPRPPLPFPGAPDAAAPSSPAQPATMIWTSAKRMMAGVRMRPMSPSRYSSDSSRTATTRGLDGARRWSAGSAIR